MNLRRIFCTASAVALTALSTVFVTTASAAPITVHCGDVFTTSNTTVTLANDVGPCTGGAAIEFDFVSNVVLDLNGHTVFGTGTAASITGLTMFGTSNMTVKNGTFTKFDSGVYLDGSFGGGDHNTITGLRVVDNVGPDASDIFGEGIQLFTTDSNRIVGNQVIHNGPFGGIIAYESSNTFISGNVVSNNNILDTSGHHGEGGPIMQDIGIWVVNLSGAPQFTTGNTVTGNTVSGSGLDGIQVARFTNQNTVTNNQVVNNGFGQPVGNGFRDGDGISNFGSFNTITGNTTVANGGNGIAVFRSVNNQGVPVGGQSNTIRANRALSNGNAPNSVAFDLLDTNTSPACDSNTWAGNTFGTTSQACIN